MQKPSRTFHAPRTTPAPPTRPPSLGSLQGRLRRSLSLSLSFSRAISLRRALVVGPKYVNVRKRSFAQVDVYARSVVLSQRCHHQRWWMRTVLGTERTCSTPTALLCKCGAQASLLRAETHVRALEVFISFWAQHRPLGAETLVKAFGDFTSFWAQHGPPGAETLVKA